MLSVRIQLWRSTVVRWWEQYLGGGDEGGRGERGDNESAGAVAARKKELVGAPSGQSSGKSRGTVDVESGTAGTAGAMTTGRIPAAPSSSSSAAAKADTEPVTSALRAMARQAIRRALAGDRRGGSSAAEPLWRDILFLCVLCPVLVALWWRGLLWLTAPQQLAGCGACTAGMFALQWWQLCESPGRARSPGADAKSNVLK